MFCPYCTTSSARTGHLRNRSTTAAWREDREAPNRCERCGAPVRQLDLTDPLLAKFAHLAQFGLAAGPPLLEPSPKDD